MLFVRFLPKSLLALTIVAAFVYIDYNIKALILLLNTSGELPVKVFGMFNIILVYNHGISFGMFSNSNYNQIMFIAPIVVIIAIIAYLVSKTKSVMLVWLYSLIIAGAIGNLIDRFKYGAVVDYLDFHWLGYHYPTFNFADAIIVVATIFFLKSDFKKQ